MFHTRLFASISSKVDHHLIHEIKKKVDGIECRLDLLEACTREEIATLMTLPTIFTWKGGDKEHLFDLLSLKPQYVDLDWQAPTSLFQKIAHLFPNIKIICSTHNMQETPADLYRLLSSIQNPYAHMYKLACFANSTLDALSMLHFVKKTGCIGVCMGELGASTRILAPVVGTPLMYAAPTQEMCTASGQLTVDELTKRYHFHSLNRQTRIYGLIGNPIAQSPSHVTHNALLEALNEDAVYVKWLVKKEELSSFFALIEPLPVYGLSVTIPHKERVPAQIGAINTLVRTKGMYDRFSVKFRASEAEKKGQDRFTQPSVEWSGFNTDGNGALDVLENMGKVKGKTVLLLGAGGASKSIAFEAKKRGAHLLIYNRTRERGEQLANSVGGKSITSIPNAYDILINTTPEKMPIPEESIVEKSIVMDLCPSPILSPLLAAAQKKNCLLVTGFEMFLAQAQGQFALWLPEKLKQAAQELEKIKAAHVVKRRGSDHNMPQTKKRQEEKVTLL